ncbi:MAG TPA: cupin domain-containing protein [Microlunatus sp.]|nr:cupin domain-containing protein [Microlunatus sp.]
MPSASRSTTPAGIDLDIVEGRYAELDAYTVSFETFKQDLDVSPYFRGLPGDACTCTHLGYVTAGQITFRWPDHDEVYVEGDAYVAAPGHRPVIVAGTSVVEFSLTAELAPVMETIGRNIEVLNVALSGAGA